MNNGITTMKTILHQHRYWFTPLLAVFLASCQMAPVHEQQSLESITSTLEQSMVTSEPEAAVAAPVEIAPQDHRDMQETVAASEQRFDVSVNAAPAREFFLSLVKDTTVNLVVHPEVSGKVSITLQDVTLDEVLETVRDIYGYEYRRNKNTYQVFPSRIHTQIFKVDYLDIKRRGGSRTSISSGQVNKNDSSATPTSNTATTGNAAGATSGTSSQTGSVVMTESDSTFWKDLRESLLLLIGNEDGRKVVVHEQTGIIVVHGSPEELRDVGSFLATVENAAHRLVVLEAKIIEVTLNDKFQAGINWNALFEFGMDKSILLGHSGGGTVFDTGVSSLAGSVVPLGDGSQVTGFDTTAFGGMFTINANLNDFNAFIELLKTQGDVQVLSSPRISTINNQKALIKVGQDEYFVTDVSTDTETVTGVSNRSVDVTLTPFFSGVALDVTPQISEDNSVILHIHPAISDVTEKTRNIQVSTSNDGNDEISIPLALSTIRETDTVIRANSGQVVVLGGLMKDIVSDDEARTPVLGDMPVIGNMFRHSRQTITKSELVILLRPVVINRDEQWTAHLRDTADRFQNLRPTNENTR
jgi:MSHA biogenesis protein MshL